MWNKRFVKFLFFSFGLVIVVNIVHPVTPQFIKNTGTGTWIFGYMFASMSVGSILMARRWGAISDKYGRKYTLLIPICFFYALTQFLMSISTSASMILFSRLLSGMVGAAVIWTIMPAYISDISKSKNKVKAQIILNSVVGFAAPVGYLFGGWLGVIIGPSKTIMVQALLAIFMFVPGYFLVDNNTNIMSRQGVKIKTTWETIKQYRGKNLFLFCFSILPFFIFRKTGQKFLDVLLLNESGFTSLQIGETIMWIGLFSTSFILIAAPFISRKIKDLNLLIFLSLWIGILLITAGLFRNIPFIIQIHKSGPHAQTEDIPRETHV